MLVVVERDFALNCHFLKPVLITSQSLDFIFLFLLSVVVIFLLFPLIFLCIAVVAQFASIPPTRIFYIVDVTSISTSQAMTSSPSVIIIKCYCRSRADWRVGCNW